MPHIYSRMFAQYDVNTTSHRKMYTNGQIDLNMGWHLLMMMMMNNQAGLQHHRWLFAEGHAMIKENRQIMLSVIAFTVGIRYK